jgi:hypothetical protein
MSFDLRADVAEVPRKEGSEQFTLKLKLAREIKELRAAQEPDEKLIAEKEAELARETYTVEFAAVPRRRREEIYQESLDKFQAKPSFFAGHVDEGTQFKRNNFVRIALVASAATSMRKGDGDPLTDPDAIHDAIEFLHNDAPDQIFARLEKKVNEINAEEDEQDALNKSTDF